MKGIRNWLLALVLAVQAASAAVVIVVSSSDAGGGGSGSPSTSWVGIPDPTGTLGYDPIAVTEPADPSEWPGAESTGNYYIDSGDVGCSDANTFGFPDTPRCSIPTSPTIDGGFKMVILGDGEAYNPGANIVATGTASSAAGDQAWIVGRSDTDITVEANKPQITGNFSLVINADFGIIDGIKIFGQDNEESMLAVTAFGTIRNSVIQGTGVDIGTANGSGIGVQSNTVLYNLTIYDLGDWQTTATGDYHALKPGDLITNTWILNVTSEHVQGDCVQVGSQNGTAASTTNHYIGGLVCSETKENAVDVKDATDVVISGGECFLMGTAPSGDSGPCIVLHDEATNVWVRGMLMRDSTFGVVASGPSTNSYILDNVFRDIDGTVGNGGLFDPGSAVSCQTNVCSVANNTIHNVRAGSEFTEGSDKPASQHVNNIYRARNSTGHGAEHFDLGQNYNVSGGEAWGDLPSDNNLYDETLTARAYNDGTFVEPLSSWPAGTDANSSEADPLFTDEANDDFTLQAGSPAIDAGFASVPLGYAEGQTRIGEDFKFDFAGNPRPATAADWDRGAYERQ